MDIPQLKRDSLILVVVNPRHMRRRVTVVSFVCLSVCSTSTRFVVDLHGPSKVLTSFKRYYLALNNMDYAKNVLFKRYGVIYLPCLSVAVLWTASTATVRYYPDKQS